MIIQRYLLREIAATFLGVALLLSLIFLSGTFVQILSEAAAGVYPASVVLQLFALKGIGNLVFILPLAFFLAILLALGRFYRDSEMTVLYACGVGPGRLYRSVALLGVAVAILLALLALYFAPWSEERAQEILDRAGASSQLDGLTAGRFNKLGAEDQLVYVESISHDRTELDNLFVTGSMDGRQEVLSAAHAYRRVDPRTGAHYLVFTDGYRYEGTPGSGDFRIIAFKEHGIRLVPRALVPSERSLHAISSLALWRAGEPGALAELQWRVSVPLITLLLGLLAVPLSKSTPREGRYGRLAAGILLYVLYTNLLSMAKTSVAKGSLSPWIGLWWVHLLFAALLLAILWRQRRLRGPRRGWRWAR